MKTITFTDAEFALVKHAVESFNDMSIDCLLDDLPVEMYPSPDKPTVLTYEKAKEVRKELDAAISKAVTLRALMEKIGSKVNEDGFSV